MYEKINRCTLIGRPILGDTQTHTHRANVGSGPITSVGGNHHFDGIVVVDVRAAHLTSLPLRAKKETESERGRGREVQYLGEYTAPPYP